MRANIKRKVYDTESSKLINSKAVGEFGDTKGYEEKVYQTNRGLYFIYGIGGTDSPYPEETIKPITQEEADAWGNESAGDKKPIAEKKGRAKKSVQGKQSKEPKAKTSRKPATKKATKIAEPVNIETSKDTETIKDTAEKPEDKKV